jgi:hypothetical protein
MNFEGVYTQFQRKETSSLASLTSTFNERTFVKQHCVKDKGMYHF